MMENLPTSTTEVVALKISQASRDGARRLASSGIASARLDAELLLGHVLGLSSEQLVLNAKAALSAEQLARYEHALARRLKREPLAYITGRQEFWSLAFNVSPDVLIPRPETECLVEAALKAATGLDAHETLRILDIGTGSGAIAIALASELPAAEIFATDVSAQALTLAQENAAMNGVLDRVRFFQGDLFAPIGRAQFDLILSNPPYIWRAEIDGLEPEVSCWEPRQALDGGVDGLDFYRRIAAEAFDYLQSDGAMIVEIGAEQGAAVVGLFQRAVGCVSAAIAQDYSGKDRIVMAQRARI